MFGDYKTIKKWEPLEGGGCRFESCPDYPDDLPPLYVIK